jgi:uracil-DNA glycosylase
MTLSELNSRLIRCRKCPRLVAWREKVALEKRRAYRDEEYWAKPVPGFGDPKGRVFVVGLAPGAHGSNRTGRQFTGDASGDFLYRALYRAGFASQPRSVSRDDGLVLTDLYTAPVCRCAPPDNRPTPEEMKNCRDYLVAEIDTIRPRVFVALGRIAFDAILQILMKGDSNPGKSPNVPPFHFSHHGVFRIDSQHWLISSYHPSRQNTQTGRLTEEMFSEIWASARKLVETMTVSE